MSSIALSPEPSTTSFNQEVISFSSVHEGSGFRASKRYWDSAYVFNMVLLQRIVLYSPKPPHSHITENRPDWCTPGWGRIDLCGRGVLHLGANGRIIPHAAPFPWQGHPVGAHCSGHVDAGQHHLSYPSVARRPSGSAVLLSVTGSGLTSYV